MNTRQNLLAAVRGEKVDYIPSGFWLHFPDHAFHGQNAINAHLDFAANTHSSIMKIMNENVFPYDVPILTPDDWANIRPFSKHAPFIQDQLDITKRILDKTKDQSIVLLTIHGIVASAWHARGGTSGYETRSSLLAEHFRQNPNAVKQGWTAIAQTLVTFTEEAMKLGIDGIYYAALGGESYLFNDTEFDQFVKPFDLQILQAAQNPPAFNILHICKDNLNLARYLQYPADVINWGIYEQNPSLLEGRKLFPDKTILGGLDDRAGVLVDGDENAIIAEVKRIIAEVGTKRFILGADCTLPTDISMAHIRAAVDAAKSIK